MDSVTVLGLVAAVFTTGSFLPQAIKTWKTKSTKDVSIAMYALLCTGIVLWTAYGILINSVPVIVANVVSFIFTFAILALKIKYK
jgi:MtN3 and saliva related transmembrane protein